MTSKIEWTEETWNPIVGCSKVSDGCKNCYALPMAYRLMNNPKTSDVYAGTTKREKNKTTWTGRINLNEKALLAPLKWKKPRKIFVNSMSDLFHEDVPDEFIDKIFAVMALCPQHTFQILTKRPERMQKYLSDNCKSLEIRYVARDLGYEIEKQGNLFPLTNVWAGVPCSKQWQRNREGLNDER